MEHWLWIILAALFFECKGEDRVIQPTGDVIVTEGQTVTLDCAFQTSGSLNPYLFWYKQDGNNSPKFILNQFKGGTGRTEDEFKERFSSTLDSTSKSVPLKIQKLQLSDSAVYYCALNDGDRKLIFGSGTSLTIEPKEEYQPSFYKVGDGDTKACLATGFSRFKVLENDTLFNETKPIRISQDSLYNQVALISSEQEDAICDSKEAGESGKCEDTLEPDPIVNLVSMTITGLRLLLFKTIVFNVLMTFRLWISQ